jgi:hypothetical protein
MADLTTPLTNELNVPCRERPRPLTDEDLRSPCSAHGPEIACSRDRYRHQLIDLID